MFHGCFPRRNRIIAGLSAVTIVVEAAQKSGASITAQYAIDADRTVAAVPGPIDVPTSYTPNHLIRDGAQVIASVDDALSLLKLPPLSRGSAIDGDPSKKKVSRKRSSKSVSKSVLTPRAQRTQNIPSDLSSDEQQILAVLQTSIFTTDTLIQHLQLPTPRCLAALTTLEIRGLIQTQLTGEILRI